MYVFPVDTIQCPFIYLFRNVTSIQGDLFIYLRTDNHRIRLYLFISARTTPGWEFIYLFRVTRLQDLFIYFGTISPGTIYLFISEWIPTGINCIHLFRPAGFIYLFPFFIFNSGIKVMFYCLILCILE